MKRKLRIFSNIAIICLSVCMFAFGVYAASTVSVTTSGTVTFSATDVYASVTRSVKDGNQVLTSLAKTVTFDSSTTSNEVWNDANLVFTDANKTITMMFEITNLASDRNLNLTVADNQSVTGTETISKEFKVRRNTVTGMVETKYDGTNYNINPTGFDGNKLVIVIEFKVLDANVSGLINYNYAINLSAQEEATNVTATDTAKTTYTRVGNLFVSETTLANGEYLNNTITGTESYMEYQPTVSGLKVTTPILVVGSTATTISASIRNSLILTGDVVIPMAQADASSVGIITSVASWGSGIYIEISDASSITSLHLPHTLTEFNGSQIYNAKNMRTLTMSKGGLLYSEGNCIIDANNMTLIGTCPTSVIPENVTTIGGMSFSKVTYRTTFTVPNHIKYIDVYSFAENNTLEELLFEENSVLERIGGDGNGSYEEVFYYGGSGLKTIGTIPKSVKYLYGIATGNNGVQVTSISFEDGSQLKEMIRSFDSWSNLKTVSNLPEGLEVIGDNTFQACALEGELVIPSTVKVIGNSAFYYCSIGNSSNQLNIVYKQGFQLEEVNDYSVSTDMFNVNYIVLSRWMYNNISSDSDSLLYQLYDDIQNGSATLLVLESLDDGSNPTFNLLDGSYGKETNSYGTFNIYRGK